MQESRGPKGVMDNGDLLTKRKLVPIRNNGEYLGASSPWCLARLLPITQEYDPKPCSRVGAKHQNLSIPDRQADSFPLQSPAESWQYSIISGSHMSSGDVGHPVPPYEIVRQSCRAALERNPNFRLNPLAIQAFRSELDVKTTKEFGSSLAGDINYTGTACPYPRGVLQEASVIVLLHALDFGSGWRTELHRHHGKGAFLTIKPGVEALFQSSPGGILTADWLESGVSKFDVGACFNIAGNSELESLVNLIHEVIVELGVGCRSYGSLETFVEHTLAKNAASTTPAGDFVWALIESFPLTFNDVYDDVCFYKKAQLVVGELYHRFRKEDERFLFVDGDNLTAFIDNVICATLRYKNILTLPESVTAMIETGQELPKGSESEVMLRASALCAVESIVASTDLTSTELGNYLWGGLGKDPVVRQYKRHATKTVFY